MQQVTAALIEKDGKILLALRKAGKHMGRKWEFPGGKVHTGETPEKSLERELVEEFSIVSRIGQLLGSVTYREAGLHLEILLYRVEHICGSFELREHEELESYDLVESDRLLVRRYLFPAP